MIPETFGTDLLLVMIYCGVLCAAFIIGGLIWGDDNDW